MTIYRIYDETIGQRAGIKIVSTTKGQIANDGTEAYVQLFALTDETGALISAANPLDVTGGGGSGSATSTATNQVTEIGLLGSLVTAAQDTAPVNVYPLPATPKSGLTTAMTTTTSTAVTGMGAPATGKFNYITQVTIGNSHATVGTFVEFQNGSAGTSFYKAPAAAVYGGAALSFPTPLKQTSAATALYCKCTTAGANVIVSVSGFQA